MRSRTEGDDRRSASAPTLEVINVFVLEDGSGGNALGLVKNGEDFTGDEMQSLANELGYSETIFLSETSNGVAARIFTPGVEVPFAGHPLVGACWYYGRGGRTSPFAISTLAGAVVCSFDLATQVARARTPQSLSTFAAPAADELARALTLDPAMIATSPIGLSIGLPFVVVELRTRDQLSGIVVDTDYFRAVVEPTGADAVMCWTRASGCDHQIDARMFSPLDGIGEDPATGSACGALAAFLTADPPAPFAIRILQGEDMGQPCDILAEVDLDGAVYLSGRCVLAIPARPLNQRAFLGTV